jgi:uncharacterized membrane protein
MGFKDAQYAKLKNKIVGQWALRRPSMQNMWRNMRKILIPPPKVSFT